ncbi:MAG: zinc ABC transporter substrate-binding protein [Synergistaceae bacterium]|nr:zinc ABC transporter substrate-binding protein [Synergistaceae bacterium]
MKKILCVLLCLAALTVPACAGSININVEVTIFPLYDWVRELVKGSEGVSVNLLLDDRIDLHSYQPSVDDMVRIAGCNMFVYVGGESDRWAEAALKNVTNKKQVVINALEILGDLVKHEEIIEGMQHEHEHEHEHEAHEHEHEHEEPDEHVWLSLRNAEVICRYIASKLGQIAPVNKKIYDSNLDSYVEKLTELDGKYSDVIKSSDRKVLLFADRFPFRYLVDDYGLKYYAAFSGCSAESEASFETVKFLAEKTNELDLAYVMTIEGTRHKIAQTVIANTKAKNQKVLVLNSMQSVSPGESYLKIMSDNLEVLKEALN